MSVLKSQVGSWKLNWKTIPHGPEGKAVVQVEGQGEVEVSWRIDRHGLWLKTEKGVFGYDVSSELDDSGQKTFSLTQRNSPREWNSVTVSLGNSSTQTAARPTQAKTTKVKAQMPGKMIRILVKPEQIVEKDQPVMVMEAMKMENEIRAPSPGRVSQVHVTEGQAVETGAELLRIEPVLAES